MKIEVIRELSTAELKERLDEERNHLTKLKISHAISPLDNPNKIREQRKTIARMLTELRSRELTKKEA